MVDVLTAVVLPQSGWLRLVRPITEGNVITSSVRPKVVCGDVFPYRHRKYILTSSVRPQIGRGGMFGPSSEGNTFTDAVRH